MKTLIHLHDDLAGARFGEEGGNVTVLARVWQVRLAA